MKYRVLFSLKNHARIVKTGICCSRDWRLKALKQQSTNTLTAQFAVLLTYDPGLTVPVAARVGVHAWGSHANTTVVLLSKKEGKMAK